MFFGSGEIEIFRQAFPGCREIEYFNKAFSVCGEIEIFKPILSGVERLKFEKITRSVIFEFEKTHEVRRSVNCEFRKKSAV